MAMTLIQTATTTGAATSIVFSSIPQTYETLYIKALVADHNGGVGRNDFTVTFNSDSSSNYRGCRFLFYDGNNRLVDFSGTAQGSTHAMPQSGNGARFTGIDFMIPNYTNTSYNKAMHSVGGYGAATNQVFLNLVTYNNLNNTQAVSSITFTPVGGAFFAANSTISLYGLK